MSIWIKAQDGGLFECRGIVPVISYKFLPDPEGSPFPIKTEEVETATILGRDGNHCDILGAYPTGAETMQVLREIQNYIEAVDYYKWVGKDRDMPCPPSVFQMPEAGFSQPEKFTPDCGGDFCGLINPELASEIKKGQYCSDVEICKAAWNRGCR